MFLLTAPQSTRNRLVGALWDVATPVLNQSSAVAREYFSSSFPPFFFILPEPTPVFINKVTVVLCALRFYRVFTGFYRRFAFLVGAFEMHSIRNC